MMVVPLVISIESKKGFSETQGGKISKYQCGKIGEGPAGPGKKAGWISVRESRIRDSWQEICCSRRWN